MVACPVVPSIFVASPWSDRQPYVTMTRTINPFEVWSLRLHANSVSTLP